MLWRISTSAVTNSGPMGVPTLFGDDDDPDDSSALANCPQLLV
jgi:hypothetical protein